MKHDYKPYPDEYRDRKTERAVLIFNLLILLIGGLVGWTIYELYRMSL